VNDNPWESGDSMLDLGRGVLAAQPFSELMGAELARFEPGEAELRLCFGRSYGSSSDSRTAVSCRTWSTTR
jgi:hypothetical protein